MTLKTNSTEENKLVSIIIPTYKRADMLKRAIDSALRQTYKNIEVIVVDDNDPDTEYRKITEDIMRPYQNELRVVYIQHLKNMNGAVARNTGIKASKGDWISFLDDDDLYLPEKVEKQVNYLKEHKEHNAVYCGRIQKGKRIMGVISGDLSQHLLQLSFTPTTPALMFRRSVFEQIGGFDEQFRRHQDLELLLRYFKTNTIGAVSEPLVEIGQNEGENELHGKLLEKNKQTFLDLFRSDIEQIEMKNSGFKNRVYTAHYVRVFCDHLGQREFLMAIEIYIKGITISFFRFNTSLLQYMYHYCRFLIAKSYSHIKRVRNAANRPK